MTWLPLTRYLLKVPPAPISATDRGALITGPWRGGGCGGGRGALQISASAGAGRERYGKFSPGEDCGEEHILGLHL